MTGQEGQSCNQIMYTVSNYTQFRLWALINRKVCGLVLPQKTDDQTDDEFEDAAINRLIEEALQDLEFNGHPVISIPVPCNRSEVVIHGKVQTHFNVLSLKLI